MAKKRIISLSVDSSVYKNFLNHCKKEGLIVSKKVENFMRDYLEEEE